MKTRQKNKPPSIHPNAQIIITGKSLTPEQARDVISFTKGLSLNTWCAGDGSIGHIDSIKPNTTYEKFYGELLELSGKFEFLDLGISVMSGPPGTFTFPVASFQIKKNTVKKAEDVHFGHPAPKRVKTVV